MSESLSPPADPLTPAPNTRSPFKRYGVPLLKFAIAAVVLWYVVRAMRAEFTKTTSEDLAHLTPNWLLVIAAALCLAGMNTVQMIRYRSLLLAYGARPTWTQMLAIAWIPPLGKYVPGSVWALMGAIGMLKRFGINVAIAISVVLMVDAFGEIMGLILSVPLLMRPPISEHIPGGKWTAPLLLTVGIVTLAPPILGRLVQLALRIIRRPPLSRLPTWGEYVVPVLSAIAQYVFAGGALWLMTRSVAHVSPLDFPWFVMVAACAMAIGYLFFVAPGGLGVREWIFLALLPPLLPTDAPHGTVAIVTIGMRLLQVIVELSLAGLGAIALRKTDHSPDR